MASSYFTLPSFARAKKNQEELEKTNPQDPVLKDEDEKFLEKQISKDDAAPKVDDSAIAITDDGEAKEVSKEEAGGDAIVPETQPQAAEGDDAPDPDDQDPSLLGQSKDGATDASYDNALKEKAADAKEKRKAKKDKGMELPSQEEAEAATRGFNAQTAEQEEKSAGEKRTWASYLPTSVRPGSRKTEDSTTSDQTSTDTPKIEDDSTVQRTWASYAASYVPSLPTRKPRKEDPDAKPKPIYNEDGTIDEKATAEQQEREVSVLLDNLNLSSINSRVFPLTQETQKLYSRFAQCLKDVINGAPTAYEDMDKLMKEAGPKLEEQWKQMPPFVQTLVKSLPAKMGGVVGPEMLAAVASEKPGEDMKRRMAAASQPADGGSGGLNLPDVEKGEAEKKSKRRIPGMKSLIGEKSAVAGMLRSVVTFLQTRFPLLASTTNVVMSLAVFILMFVFWYCHKRGKEVRLAKEAEEVGNGEDTAEGAEDDGFEASSEEDGEEDDETDQALAQQIDDKEKVLSQPEPTEVPLPSEEEKSVAAGSDEKTT